MDSWTHSFAPEYTMGPGLDFDRLPCSFGGNFFRRDLPEEIPDQPSSCTVELLRSSLLRASRPRLHSREPRGERGICISVEIPEPGSHSRPRDSCVTVKPRGKLCLPTFLSAATKLLASIVAKSTAGSG